MEVRKQGGGDGGAFIDEGLEGVEDATFVEVKTKHPLEFVLWLRFNDLQDEGRPPEVASSAGRRRDEEGMRG
jgi:hypothetical protein